MPRALYGARGMTVRTEVLAGVTTFMTMSYIAVVNPAILSDGTGLPFAGVMTATVLVAALGSIAMGAAARLPYAVAPGMGLNAFVTYTLILGDGLTAGQALGAVVASGALFVALSATPARAAIARAIPPSLRVAAAAGIGLLLALLGLRAGGVIVDNPATLIAPGEPTVEMALFAGGLLLTAVLAHYRVRGALLLGIAAITAAAAALGHVPAPDRWLSLPDFSTVGMFELDAIWRPALIGPLLTLLLTDLFDSLSTLLGVSHAAGLVDEQGEPVRLGRALVVDAFATLGAGILGSSPGTTYVESAAGIREGGRTGLTAIIAGACFLPLLFIAPAAAAIPPVATAPALVLVGVMMFAPARHLTDEHAADLLPAFLTLALIPLTVSITQGLVWGVLSHVALRALTGRIRDIAPALWAVAAACIAVLAA